jgi:para-aminobenzoate synthetase component 1
MTLPRPLPIGAPSGSEAGLPLVRELRPAPDPEAAFVRLALERHCLFLDSALREPSLGRYSFLAADPFEYWECDPDTSAGLVRLRKELVRWQTTTVRGLPPFQGGAAGMLSYDLSRSLERVPRPRYDEFRTPGLAIGLFDTVLAFDHAEHRAWIIAQGFPEVDPERRRRRAQQRIEQFSARPRLMTAGRTRRHCRLRPRTESSRASSRRSLKLMCIPR